MLHVISNVLPTQLSPGPFPSFSLADNRMIGRTEKWRKSAHGTHAALLDFFPSGSCASSLIDSLIPTENGCFIALPTPLSAPCKVCIDTAVYAVFASMRTMLCYILQIIFGRSPSAPGICHQYNWRCNECRLSCRVLFFLWSSIPEVDTSI